MNMNENSQASRKIHTIHEDPLKLMKTMEILQVAPLFEMTMASLLLLVKSPARGAEVLASPFETLPLRLLPQPPVGEDEMLGPEMARGSGGSLRVQMLEVRPVCRRRMFPGAYREVAGEGQDGFAHDAGMLGEEGCTCNSGRAPSLRWVRLSGGRPLPSVLRVPGAHGAPGGAAELSQEAYGQVARVHARHDRSAACPWVRVQDGTAPRDPCCYGQVPT